MQLKPGVGPPVPIRPRRPEWDDDGYDPPDRRGLKVIAAVVVVAVALAFLVTSFDPANVPVGTAEVTGPEDTGIDAGPAAEEDPLDPMPSASVEGRERYPPVHPETDPTPVPDDEEGPEERDDDPTDDPEEPMPPRAAFTVRCDGRDCTFDASSSRAGSAPIAGYAWDLGDGTGTNGEIVFYRYGAAATYTVTLTVNDTDGQTSTATQEVTLAPESAGPVHLQGNGSDTSAVFRLEDGLLHGTFSYGGSGVFRVWLQPSDGDAPRLLVDRTGPYDGSRYHGVTAGDHQIVVEANGAWEIRLDQPRPEDGAAVPVVWSGAGDTASPFLALEARSYVFQFNVSDAQELVVRLYASDGTSRLIYEGNGTGAENLTIELDHAGYYALDIATDGAWETRVEEG